MALRRHYPVLYSNDIYVYIHHCIVENEAPTINIVSGNNRINAQVGSSIEMVFTGQDDKTFVYDIINQPVAGFIADNSTGNLSLRWTPANVNTERIR